MFVQRECDRFGFRVANDDLVSGLNDTFGQPGPIAHDLSALGVDFKRLTRGFTRWSHR